MNSLTDSIWTELKQQRIPRATYRIQFSPTFTFKDAALLVPYLDELGISTLYASPIFKPRAGSLHGYDVVDYNDINPVLGTEEDLRTLCAKLRQRGMDLLLDIVPNHMGVSTDNEWWTDVLKHGPSSIFARYFDIDWKPRNRTLDNKILLPVLHSHFGEVLEEGHLSVVYWHGDFYVHYFENQFPMTPESYIHILDYVIESLPDALEDSEAWIKMEIASVRHSLQFLPDYWLTDSESIAIRRREQHIIRSRILGLFDKSQLFRSTLQSALDAINGAQGVSTSFDILDNILSVQPYHLAFWQVASDEINYRRFFDINDMAAIRTEDLQVFADSHRLTFKLLAEGLIAGLRIDHPDGLWDPERYFWRLQTGYVDAVVHQKISEDTSQARAVAEQLNAQLESLKNHSEWPLYVLGEKILSDSESLPETWAIQGTTGYDFMYAVNSLFIDTTTEDSFNQLYAAFTGEYMDFEELTDFTKKLIMNQSLTSEIEALTAKLARIVEKNRRFRGFTQNSLALVLSEFMASMDIYRTYITGPSHVSTRDQKYIEAAMRRAKINNPLVPESVFDFVQDVLLMKNFHLFDASHHSDLKDFVMKFQQITGPVMAKSVEDTAFYIYNRLTSLNEVGGHPDRFGISIDDFHAHNNTIQEKYPYTMLSTSTHDTKRSEDVRARINVLSEMPEAWHNAINTWSAINSNAFTRVNGHLAPSRNDEYLLYQTLLGIFQPGLDENTFKNRIIGYMHKAINEAKTHSNWVNPNREYACAVSTFIEQIWEDDSFRASFESFHETIAYFGRLNSISQLILKLTSPGVPDIYQGAELWNFNLVDPDNRQAVDFGERRELLESVIDLSLGEVQTLVSELVCLHNSGKLKLYLLEKTLSHRKKHTTLYSSGSYIPIQTAGTYADHVCAFIRKTNTRAMLVIVPRLFYRLLAGESILPLGHDCWLDTCVTYPEDLSERISLTNIFTGESMELHKNATGKTIMLKDVLLSLPVALLDITTR